MRPGPYADNIHCGRSEVRSTMIASLSREKGNSRLCAPILYQIMNGLRFMKRTHHVYFERCVEAGFVEGRNGSTAGFHHLLDHARICRYLGSVSVTSLARGKK
jgi:hypothetical protein